MRSLLTFGIVLLFNEVALLVYWMAVGIVVAVHDSTVTTEHYLIVHLVNALHFAAAMCVALVIENYKWFRAKIKTESEEKGVHAKSALAHGLVETVSGYAVSWMISLAIVFGTDLFSMIHIILLNSTDFSHTWNCLLAFITWAILSTLTEIIWSVFLVVYGRNYEHRHSSK
jgi:hypothetical protein